MPILGAPLRKGTRIHAYLGTNQIISHNTTTKIQLDTESYDEENEFDPTTNHRFTATEAGYYLITGNLQYDSCVMYKQYHIRIHKNGSYVCRQNMHASSTSPLVLNLSVVLKLAVDDYIELFTYHNSGVGVSKNVVAGASITYLVVFKLSR